MDIGLQDDVAEAMRAPLPVIAVDDPEASLQAAVVAGGRIVRPIFALPGSRRFQSWIPMAMDWRRSSPLNGGNGVCLAFGDRAPLE